MKRIVFLTQMYLPRMGGLQLQTHNLCKRLVKKGYDIHIITILDPHTSSYTIIDGIKIHRIPRGKLPIVSTLKYFRKVISLVKKIKPDHIHEQGISGLGYFIKKKFSVKVSTWGRGNDVYNTQFIHTNYTIKMTLRNVDYVLAQTEHMASRFKSLYNRDVIVIPNGIDITKKNSFNKNDLRRKYGFDKNDFIVSNVNRLLYVKGVSYLIEAIAKLKKENPYMKIKAIIIGDGPQKKEFEELSSSLSLDNEVFFVGAQSFEGIFEYNTLSDLFVEPTFHTEGFPGVFLEALLAGIPIISTDWLAIPEIIKDGKSGYIIPIKDSEAISKKIKQLYDNPSIRKKMSDYNLKLVEKYKWDNIVSMFESKILDSKK